jgi:hypothetical protein
MFIPSILSTQWAVSDTTTGDCKSFLFIGLKEYKFGTSGSCAGGEDVSNCLCPYICIIYCCCFFFLNLLLTYILLLLCIHIFYSMRLKKLITAMILASMTMIAMISKRLSTPVNLPLPLSSSSSGSRFLCCGWRTATDTIAFFGLLCWLLLQEIFALCPCLLPLAVISKKFSPIFHLITVIISLVMHGAWS